MRSSKATVFGVLFLALMLWASDAHGEAAPADDPVDTDGAVSLSENDRAPFQGILFPTDLAIQMGFRIETLQARLRLDVDREQRICQAQADFQDQRLRIETERRDFQIGLLQHQVDDQAAVLARPTPWYRQWGFAFGMGIVVSSLLVGGGIALILTAM
jgi:hypothetical protein